MKKNYILGILIAFLALALPAQSRFKKVRFAKIYNCENNTSKGTLDFVAGAPNGTY